MPVPDIAPNVDEISAETADATDRAILHNPGIEMNKSHNRRTHRQLRTS